ncbi:MAG: CDP-diacylglycerol--glycerol-3-phosphate 3-phosphatidyltransferase [Planctomycetota bacterium]
MALPRSLPNQLTIARIVLAVVLFVILHGIGWAERPDHAASDFARGVLSRKSLLLNLGAGIFFAAAISDILDGQIARRWNLTTDFGRIADPFADKVIVSGAFLFLVPIAGSGVSAWMVAVIVARESLVDGIRGFAEARGIAFPASVWGKAKMVAQSATVILILLALANAPHDPRAQLAVQSFIAFTIFATLFSGLLYVLKARTLLRRGAEGEKVAASPATAEAAR